jgi:dihydroorotate dehydrogenase (NAD+) catalytic subunit
VRAVALAQVHSVREAVEIPIVGMGGVQRGQDALDLMRAGADVVAVGTESFRDPRAGSRIACELARHVANSEERGDGHPALPQSADFRGISC